MKSASHNRTRPSAQEISTLSAFFARGQMAEAAAFAHRLTQNYPQNGIGWTTLGVAFNQMGRHADALGPMQKAVALSQNDADAHSNLAYTLNNLGRFEEAEKSCRRAIQIKPDFAEAYNNLGNALRDLGRLSEAEACFQRALQIKPGFAEAHNNLGSTLRDLGRLDEAESSYRRALDMMPSLAGASYNLGNILKDKGQLLEAESRYRRAVAINPNYVEAHYNLGNALMALGRLDEAKASYVRALEIKPDFAEAHNNLGNLLRDCDQLEEAVACYRRALDVSPGMCKVQINLGNTLKDLGRNAEAEAAYRRAIEIDSQSCEPRVALMMLKLPIAPTSLAESLSAPAEFDRALNHFSGWLDTLPDIPADYLTGICSQQPFYLAYRDGNHVEPLSRYGDLVTRNLENRHDTSAISNKEKLRLVIVSRYFLQHPVWYIILRGLIEHIDREKFEVILYSLGQAEDSETKLAKSLADTWRDARSINSVSAWQATMVADKPDVIFYPAIGMDPVSLRLAAHRLAPLQVTSWGHPITTGLPTIDIYFSGELLEPADADKHYRERLVRLPGTGCCTTPLEVIPEPVQDLAKRFESRTGPRFVIAQTPFKFDPSDDTLFARIAADVGECTFILLRPQKFQWATDLVLARLGQAFKDQGLDPEKYLLVLPWLPQQQFHGLLESCDVYLDCPSFSGYTTAWQAIYRGLPIVTLEGKFMRQRLAAGLLRRVGLTDTIATSEDSYVQLAAALAKECQEPTLRKIRRDTFKSASSRMNNDVSVVRAFEKSVLDAYSEKASA